MFDAPHPHVSCGVLRDVLGQVLPGVLHPVIMIPRGVLIDGRVGVITEEIITIIHTQGSQDQSRCVEDWERDKDGSDIHTTAS